MFRMGKTIHSSKDCKRCLFIVTKTDIIWSSWKTPEFINYQIWTTYKTFLSLKYLFHFFLSNGCLYVIIMSRPRFRVNLHSIVAWMSRNSFFETGTISEVSVNSNFMDTLKHSSDKFSLVCSRLLDSFNENVLRQRDLDKYF